jgi:hypothetical protein
MTAKQMAEVQAKAELGVTPEASNVFGRRYSKFSELVTELQAVNELKKSAEEDSRRINKELQVLWADVEFKSVVESDGTKITLVESVSASRVDPIRLIELGVAADTVKAATVAGNPYQFVKISVPKVK